MSGFDNSHIHGKQQKADKSRTKQQSPGIVGALLLLQSFTVLYSFENLLQFSTVLYSLLQFPDILFQHDQAHIWNTA